MAKRNNIIEEIQELIKIIKNEYQEGVDYKFHTGEHQHKGGIGSVSIVSPRLKKVLQERFNFPFRVNDYLDYGKKDENENWFTYRIDKDEKEDDLFWSTYPETNFPGRTNSYPEENPKNCAVCGKLAPLKGGRMKLWNGRCHMIGKKKDGYTCKLFYPSPIAYFHPECSQKYFTDKEKPNENSTRIKEKLLRNLDKICLDPRCDLANAEALKQEGAEENYKISSTWDEWTKKAYKVEIEGEEIELNTDKEAVILPGSYEQREIKRALMLEIKQNPLEWEIVEREVDPKEYLGGEVIIKHKSGRRHWEEGFRRFWGSVSENEKMGKELDEIKATLKGYKSPANNEKANDIELDRLKSIFRKYHITKIIFENNDLFIEYDKKVNPIEESKVDRKTFRELLEYCQNHDKKEITKDSLNISSDNTNNSSQNKDNHQLIIGLAVGASVVVLVGIIVYFFRKRKKSIS